MVMPCWQMFIAGGVTVVATIAIVILFTVGFFARIELATEEEKGQ